MYFRRHKETHFKRKGCLSTANTVLFNSLQVDTGQTIGLFTDFDIFKFESGLLKRFLAHSEACQWLCKYLSLSVLHLAMANLFSPFSCEFEHTLSERGGWGDGETPACLRL